MCTEMVQKENIDEVEKIKERLESMGVILYFRAIIKQRTVEINWDEIGLDYDEYRKFYEFKYKHVVDTIRKGEATSLNKFYTYDMVPFMECPLNDEELTCGDVMEDIVGGGFAFHAEVLSGVWWRECGEGVEAPVHVKKIHDALMSMEKVGRRGR